MECGVTQREEMIWRKMRIEKHDQVKTRLVAFQHNKQFKERSKYTSFQSQMYVDHNGCAKKFIMAYLDPQIVYAIGK
jgi:hypothetical protein